ncbi:MAG: hypothetical protein ABDH28_02460 [Brevinematia bacterium]
MLKIVIATWIAIFIISATLLLLFYPKSFDEMIILISSVPSFIGLLQLSRSGELYSLISIVNSKKKHRVYLLLSIPLPIVIILSYLLKNPISPFLSWAVIALSIITFSSQTLVLFLSLTKPLKLKKKIQFFSLVSVTLTLLLHYILKENIGLLFLGVTLTFLLIYSILSITKATLPQSNHAIMSCLTLITSFSSTMTIVNFLTEIFTIFTIISLNILISLIFTFGLKNLKLSSIILLLWATAIILSIIIFKDRLPLWLTQTSIISALIILSVLAITWYFRRKVITCELLISDIDNFLKEFYKIAPKRVENFKEVIPKLFNKTSKHLKISIVPQNSLPPFILSKMLNKRSMLINDILDSGKEIVNFFTINNLICIFRISNEVSETDYLLIKLPKVIKGSYARECDKTIMKEYFPVFHELEKTIANTLVLPLAKDIEEKREFHVREVESFEKAKYLLIKDSEVFLYFDKVIAYKYIEDTEAHRGYYFDISMSKDKLIGFLFFVPDRLFLSNFALLAIKGIIKSYSTEEITHEELEKITNNFLRERELPLQVSITSFEIVGDRILVNPSKHTKTYCHNGEAVRLIDEKLEIDKSNILIISNVDIPEKTIEEASRSEAKFTSIKKIFDKIRTLDSFVAVCI